MIRFVALITLAALTGCTSLQLKRTTVQQSETLGDIYQQQVLDNLAKFVQNPEALPDFAVPKEGSANVTDMIAQGPSSLQWSNTGFSQASLGLPQGSRQIVGAWTMDPVRDPHKLDLMRCAYQKAVAPCGIGAPAEKCPDCNGQLNTFYGVLKDEKNEELLARRSCVENSSCWFRSGCKKELPKDFDCLPVGQYCGTYVWVPPEGRAHLTRLVLNIMDYAFRDPAPGPEIHTKDVTAYFSANGDPATEATAAVVVKATVDISEPLLTAQKKLLVQEKLLVIEGAKMTPLKAVPRLQMQRTLDDKGSIPLLQLNQQLQTLTPPRPR